VSHAEKPPYRVPSMTEIAALPWNGLKVVSTFSGCGGSCLGFRMAGYRVVRANEFIPAAAETGASFDRSRLKSEYVRPPCLKEWLKDSLVCGAGSMAFDLVVRRVVRLLVQIRCPRVFQTLPRLATLTRKHPPETQRVI
jgi:hypothetical protein